MSERDPLGFHALGPIKVSGDHKRLSARSAEIKLRSVVLHHAIGQINEHGPARGEVAGHVEDELR